MDKGYKGVKVLFNFFKKERPINTQKGKISRTLLKFTSHKLSAEI